MASLRLRLRDLCSSDNASKFIDCSADRDNSNDDVFVRSRVVVAEINFVEIGDCHVGPLD